MSRKDLKGQFKYIYLAGFKDGVIAIFILQMICIFLLKLLY